MPTKNYSLPLHFGSFFTEEGGRLSTCSLLESIDHHLELLLTTCPGEHYFNKEYGTMIWEQDFELVASRSQWEESFINFIYKTVVENEKRILNIDVSIKLREVLREEGLSKSVAVRQRVDIYVLGRLLSTGEKCGFNYTLFLGPLSNE